MNIDFSSRSYTASRGPKVEALMEFFACLGIFWFGLEYLCSLHWAFTTVSLERKRCYKCRGGGDIPAEWGVTRGKWRQVNHLEVCQGLKRDEVRAVGVWYCTDGDSHHVTLFSPFQGHNLLTINLCILHWIHLLPYYCDERMCWQLLLYTTEKKSWDNKVTKITIYYIFIKLHFIILSVLLLNNFEKRR